MLHLRIYCPANISPQATALLEANPAVSSLAVMPNASVSPAGDLILADVVRESANTIIDSLRDLGIPQSGAIQIDEVSTWISRRGYEAEMAEPGAGADAVVWSNVVQKSYEDSELTWTYASFMVLATLIAGIAVILDSQVLVIGAMVLGPEFGPIAALGLALVRRRPYLFRRAATTLVAGFAIAIVATAAAAFIGRLTGLVSPDELLKPHPMTSFIYNPDRWSLIIAVIAGAAGVLALTSAKSQGIAGVFISVTTIPAAGYVAVALAFGSWEHVVGGLAQLVVNICGMAVAGWLTLLLQNFVWRRIHAARPRQAARASGREQLS